MNTKMIIGQYYPGHSVIHNLDARVKLVGTFFLIISLFFADNFKGYAAAALFLAATIFLSHVPPRFMLKGLKSITFIIIFAAFLNIFLTPGENVIFSFYFLRFTMEGLIIAVKMTLRFTLLIVASSLLTLTTSPIQMTDAIEYLLKPLKKIKVPAHELAMMMAIALRFIPTLLEEMDKIMKAQMARGADFETGGLYKRAKSLIPLLVPLFISAIRRADELADAMDARCYRGDSNRTKMKAMKIKACDYYAIGCVAVYGLAIILASIIL